MGTDTGPLFGTQEMVPTILAWVRVGPSPGPGLLGGVEGGWGGGAAPGPGPEPGPDPCKGCGNRLPRSKQGS